MITADALRRAADIQDKIESLNAELESILGSGGNGVPSPARRGRPAKGGDVDRYKAARGTESGGMKKRKMSAAGRAKIAAAARARWAKVKAKGGNSL